MSELDKKAVSGIKWVSVSTFVLVLTQMISTAILVRFLERTDFGLMALVMVVKGFADIFMDFGITVAILHEQDMSQNQYSSLYWLNMMIGAIIYFIVYLLSPLIAGFYHESALLKLIPIMCLSIPFSSIGRQQKTMLQKQFCFKQIAMVEIISALLSLAVAVFFAYIGSKVYALVLSNLVRYTLSNILYFFIGIKIMPIRFYFKLSEIGACLRIGGYHTVSQIINYFTQSLDVVIIGKLLGTDSVGLYNLAKDLVLKPAAIIAPVISKVATPFFSKIQYDETKVINSFLTIQKIGAYLNAFVYLGVFTLAAPFVPFYYGTGYVECIPLIRILSLYYLLRQYADTIAMVCVAKGRTDIDMWWNITVSLIMPIFIILGTFFSIYYVTFFLLLGQFLLLYPQWYMYPNKLLKLKFMQYYRNLVKSLLYFTVPVVITVCLMFFLPYQPITLFILGGCSFVGLIFLVFSKVEYSFLLSILKKDII